LGLEEVNLTSRALEISFPFFDAFLICIAWAFFTNICFIWGGFIEIVPREREQQGWDGGCKYLEGKLGKTFGTGNGYPRYISLSFLGIGEW